MELEFDHSIVYEKQFEALNDKTKRFIIHQGGTRSSKSYSILQSLIVYAITNKNITISVVRKTFPALRATVMKQFYEILELWDIYDESCHFVAESYYKFKSGSVVEFFSVDDSQKLRGRERDILFANEANDLTLEDFNQLNIRTKKKLIFDYNPSENYSWLYDLADKQKSVKIFSTYKDNPFLSQDQIDQIEDYKNTDFGFWMVYGLGLQAPLKENVFQHQTIGTYIDTTETLFGLDIGYNHPTALVQLSFSGNTCWVKEHIYSSNLTNSDLTALFSKIAILPGVPIICDSARPDTIEELKRAGYKAQPAVKSVKEGITAMKSFKLIIDSDSLNLQKEFRNYKWKTMGDIILDEPVKLYDDAIDATRYGFYWYYLKNYKKQTPSFDFMSLDI